MLPYFGAGDRAPDGYVWADGGTPWPDAPWVPEHLRHNKLVPNMKRNLVGGAATPDQMASFGTMGG